MRSYIRHAALSAAAVLVAVSTAGAQQGSAGPRWQAWLGCWTATAPGGAYGSAQFAGPVVCIVPTSSADIVEVATIADGKVLKRDTIDASGREKAIQSKECEGIQAARWSADERRVYLKSTVSCDGMRSSASSILGITSGGDWLDVRGVAAGEGENVRVARYHDIGLPSAVPAEIADVLRGRSMSSQSARIAAGAAIGTNAVSEASQSANAAVVEAWLLERAQRFSLSANDLVTLADAGIPAGVTDALVAVSNPEAFQVARAEDGPSGEASVDDSRYGRRSPVYLDPYYSPYGWGYSRYDDYGYGSRYGYGFGGYRGGAGLYGGSPIIIVTGTAAASGGGGQMVKGRGYTQNEPSSSSGRSSSPAPSSSGSSTSTSSSSGQSTSAPSQPAAEQRTAKPRP